MGRGIHRFVITFGQDSVKVRAQSASRTGQSFTVGGVKSPLVVASKANQKAALYAAINSFYPKETTGTL